jgi:hypothetical protein
VFPALTGSKWNKVITSLGTASKVDYADTVDFHRRAMDARNELLHRGDELAIAPGMAKQCIQHTWPLLLLFVDLHNKYVSQVVNAR